MRHTDLLGLAGLFLLVNTVSIAFADEGLRLRARFNKGERFTVIINESSEETLTTYTPQQGTEITRSDKEVGALWEILDVTPTGDAQIAVTYDYFVVKEIKNDKLLVSGDTRIHQSEAITRAVALMKTPFRFTVSNRGKILTVTGLDEMLDKWRAEVENTLSPQQRAEQDWLVEGLLGADNVTKTLSELFTPLPSTPVLPGGTWEEPFNFRLEFTNFTGLRTYRLNAYPGLSGWYVISETTKFVVTPNDKTAEIETREGTIISTATLNAKTGRLVRKSSTFRVDVSTYEKRPDGGRSLVRRTIGSPTTTITIRPTLRAEARAHLEKGIALAGQRQFDAAIRQFNRGIALQPGAAELFSNRGAARHDSGNPAAAISDLTRAIELDPGLDIAYLGRGAARIASKDYPGAIEDYTKLIELAPAFWKSYFMRGILHSLQGRWSVAIADFTDAIARNPEFPDVYRFRADAYARQGNRVAAEADLQKWRELGGRE